MSHLISFIWFTILAILVSFSWFVFLYNMS